MQRAKKWVITLLMMGIFIISLTACSNSESGLVGTWVNELGEICFVFNEDGSCEVTSFQANTTLNSINYKITENQTIIFSDIYGHPNTPVKYRIEKDRLYITGTAGYSSYSDTGEHEYIRQGSKSNKRNPSIQDTKIDTNEDNIADLTNQETQEIRYENKLFQCEDPEEKETHGELTLTQEELEMIKSELSGRSFKIHESTVIIKSDYIKDLEVKRVYNYDVGENRNTDINSDNYEIDKDISTVELDVAKEVEIVATIENPVAVFSVSSSFLYVYENGKWTVKDTFNVAELKEVLLEGVWEGEYNHKNTWRNMSLEITDFKSDGFFNFVMTLTRHPNAPTAGTHVSKGVGGINFTTGELSITETAIISSDDDWNTSPQYNGGIDYEELYLSCNNGHSEWIGAFKKN